MTPEEFARKMKEIAGTKSEYHGCDIEDNHRAMDGLMCEALCDLGYEKGVDIFLDADKWYS